MRACIARQGTDGSFTMFAGYCHGHQTVLSMKPSITRFNGVCGNLTRGPHLFQSSRVMAEFLNALDYFADKSIFKAVAELPGAMTEAQRLAAQMLVFARPSLDMTDDDEAFVRMMDNGRLDVDDATHWHTPTCQCGGPQHFRTNMRKCFQLSLGAGPVLCLLYRFRGFERAACWFHKGMHQHNILHRALMNIYVKEHVLGSSTSNSRRHNTKVPGTNSCHQKSRSRHHKSCGKGSLE